MWFRELLGIAAFTIALAACGGGGGSSDNPDPPPPPPPPPPPAEDCTADGYPAPLELASDCAAGGASWIAFDYTPGPGKLPAIFLRKPDGTCGFRVSPGTGFDYGPAFSVGGAKVAYASTRSGVNTIYVHDLAAGTEAAVDVQDSTLAAGSPSISPDGTQLAFEGSVGTSAISDIYTVPIGGGTPAKITNQASGSRAAQPVWSPDGTQLYFAKGSSYSNMDVYRSAATSGAGASATRITTSSAISGKFAVTPDGAAIVYGRRAGTETELVYENVTTKVIRVVSSQNEGDPDVSADGTQVAVSRQTAHGFELYLLDLATGNELRQLTNCGGTASAAAFAR